VELRPRYRLAVALFALTAGSVYITGGPRLVVGMLGILLAHEMGHYLACRRYGVDATLPMFLPAPVLSLVGTLGAFIRIRSPIPHRRALFDIGIAGPLAGFAVTLPVLVAGCLEARIVPDRPDQFGIYLGEPLLFQWLATAIRGTVPDGATMSLGPLGLAGWFGLFVTALNLIPIGQLDGGHIAYAVLRHRAHVLSRAGSWVCFGLVYFGPNWLVWALLLRLLGRRHPATLNDGEPIGRARVALAIFALAMFLVSFVPNPIAWSWREFFELLGADRLIAHLTSR
jgi:membrane-associated protease RseP (regulator of RpoE activity)